MRPSGLNFFDPIHESSGLVDLLRPGYQGHLTEMGVECASWPSFIGEEIAKDKAVETPERVLIQHCIRLPPFVVGIEAVKAEFRDKRVFKLVTEFPNIEPAEGIEVLQNSQTHFRTQDEVSSTISRHPARGVRRREIRRESG